MKFGSSVKRNFSQVFLSGHILFSFKIIAPEIRSIAQLLLNTFTPFELFVLFLECAFNGNSIFLCRNITQYNYLIF